MNTRRNQGSDGSNCHEPAIGLAGMKTSVSTALCHGSVLKVTKRCLLQFRSVRLYVNPKFSAGMYLVSLCFAQQTKERLTSWGQNNNEDSNLCKSSG